jgi:hypothetical protein
MLRRILLLAAACSVGLAQEYRSTVSGQVSDPQGAVIPGVSIVLTEKSTNARFETKSGEAGNYSIPLLPPGQYDLAAEIQGFKKYQRSDFTVSTNQRIQLDIVMEIGSLAETVTVTSEAPLIQTGTASVGQVITTNQVENMPMNGRTPMALAQLAYGVTPAGGGTRIRPYDNSGPADISMGGSQNRASEILIDGSPDMTRDRRVAYSPPVDAVTEVKVEAFQVDAAYGNTGGGTINVVMKGGSNEFHGTAYEFNQNTAMSARTFFLREPSPRKWNQYGLTASGPIVIPKLIDTRNKIFWFFGYEGIKSNEPEVLTSTVPTALMRQGDFSEVLSLPQCAANVDVCRIYDPLTGVQEGARIRRTAFQNNVIPSSRLSPIARNYLNFYPQPNQPGLQDNFQANARRSDDFMSALGRIDFNASDKHKMFWNFRHNDRLEDRSNRFNNIATGNNLYRTNWGSTFDDVYSFTPTLLMNIRANWTRFIEANVRPSNGFDFTTLGFPTSLSQNSARLVLPRIDLDQHQDLGDNAGNYTPFDTFQLFGSVTKVTGRHSLKFGADLRELRESSASYGSSAGEYRFTNDWTRGPLDNSAGAPVGQSLASFMLGLPNNSSFFDVNAFRTQRSRYYAFFVQDDWRVNNRLTLNMGLRYERETGTTERYDRTIVGFDYGAANRATAAARAAYAANPNPVLPASLFNPTGGVLFASPDRRNVYSTYPYAFSPRFGFAWSPGFLGSKTVIRAGYGIFYYTTGTQGIQQPGFSQRTPMVATLNNYLSPNATLANPFPQGIGQPVGNANGIDTFLGQTLTFRNPNAAQPYTQRWNLNIQRELPWQMVVEVGYLGSNAFHLTEDHDINFIPQEYLSTSLTRDDANNNRITATVPNPFAGLLPGTGLNGNTISLSQLLRPFPQFNGQNGVRIEGDNTGSSNYHAAMVRWEKRYSGGLQITSNYTFSRNMERVRRRQASDPLPEYRVADEDRPHRFVFGFNYDLPFGRGRAIGGSWNRWIDAGLGGWSLNGIYTIQSGAPINWDDRNIIYYGGDLKLQSGNGGLDKVAFDTSVFERAAARQLVNNVRYFPTRFSNLRVDRTNNADVSIMKTFRFFERLDAQLRGEFFNVANHPVFDGPITDPTNSNFGRITGQTNQARSIQVGLRLKW